MSHHETLENTAPLANTEFAEEAELTLDDIRQMHEQAGAELHELDDYHLALDSHELDPLGDDALSEELEELDLAELDEELELDDEALELDEDIELEDIEEEGPSQAAETIEMPLAALEASAVPVVELDEFTTPLIAEHTELEPMLGEDLMDTNPLSAAADALLDEGQIASHQSAREQLMLNLSNETYDLSKKDDLSYFSHQSQELFTQLLQSGIQRLGKVWNAQDQVQELYVQLENLSRQRGAVEQIISTANAISLAQETSQAEMMNKHEIEQILSKINTLQTVLARYEAIFKPLV